MTKQMLHIVNIYFTEHIWYTTLMPECLCFTDRILLTTILTDSGDPIVVKHAF